MHTQTSEQEQTRQGEKGGGAVWLKAFVNLCRIVAALLFIFSGFVKAIDPLGTQYKLEEYLRAFPLQLAVPEWGTLGVSVGLAGLEFCLGIFLLFAIHRRVVSRLMFGFMVIMTLLTLWIYIASPVEDCGCFGDAVKLTNGETLLKNIGLLVATLMVSLRPLMMVRFISKTNQWIVVNYTMLFTIALSVWCLYDRPLFDFRPFHEGADIRMGMKLPEGARQPQFETTFVLEKDGVKKEFSLDNYPDSTWTFIDSKTVMTVPGDLPLIHDFSITRLDNGLDITQEVIDNKGYTFLLIAPSLEKANEGCFGDIDRIYEYCLQQGYPFYCLTASGDKAIAYWVETTGAEYPFCATDGTTLKTIIRSNPGLVLLKDGKVVRKWSHNFLPSVEEMQDKRLEQLAIGKPQENSVSGRIMKILLWFVLPLFVLALADRLWAWTKWLKKKEETNRIYQLIKKKKVMRKNIVAGNWKMNLNLQEGIALAKELNDALKSEKPNCDVVICTPFIHLASVAQLLDQEVVGLGAENCADKEKGAYTGEVSAEMVKSTGARYVIIGHSERREYYGETPEILKEKVLLALKQGLKVIFCIGETLEEREAGKQNEVVKDELERSVFNLSAEEFKNIIVAYEPIWAIGTGKTATAEQAEEIHAFIRSIIEGKYGKDIAAETSILYGGSCKPDNAKELFAKPDIDGGLIGGASLKAADFLGIIDAWKE
ncbi:MAG: triose-phosphate isomerase [Prevotella sp.]|nr:triose-phosphate isomerase [Prevotella sp.]